MVVDKRGQGVRLGDDTHVDRPRAAADFNVLSRQGVVGKTRRRAHFVREDDLAAQAFGHVLQPCRDVDGIAERGELHMVAIADIAHDHFAAVNPDAEADRFAQVVFEELIQFLNMERNAPRRRQSLTAGGLPVGRQSKQSELPVAA